MPAAAKVKHPLNYIQDTESHKYSVVYWLHAHFLCVQFQRGLHLLSLSPTAAISGVPEL